MKHVYLCVILAFCSLATVAQDGKKDKDIHAKQSIHNDQLVEYRFALGVQIGTDIGGAIPFPFSNIPTPFNPYPKLSPSLGAKLTFPVTSQWTLGTEVTYKKVSIDADARVKDQRFNDKKNDIIARFTGSAEMNMDFTMMEVPVYVKYTFRNQKDRVLVGLYTSWIIDAEFRTNVKKGYITEDDGTYTGPIDESNPLYINFDNILDNWDVGFVLGYERQLFPRVDIGLRFSCGVKDIFESDNQYFDYSMLHMRGTVVLSYNLFNIKSPKLSKFHKR